MSIYKEGFYEALDALARNPMNPVMLDYVCDHWNNRGWTSGKEYIRAGIKGLYNSDGAVLECGTGLTTCILGRIAGDMGRLYVALEQCDSHHAKMQPVLAKAAPKVVVCLSSIKNYGSFDWYTDFPTWHGFDLVICDGPLGGTKGNRSGLVPLMRDQLSLDCTILLDDVNRSAEQKTMESWKADFQVAATKNDGKTRQFAVIRRKRSCET